MIGVIVTIFVVCGIVIALLMHNAPVGWEDSAGFHKGNVDDTKGRE